MEEEQVSAFVLQAHDTPLSEILYQHRKILEQINQFLNTTTNNGKLYPFYPCHGIIDFEGSVQELKKQITSYKILPPTYEKGFFFRPIELSGAKIGSLPKKLVCKVLPFLREENYGQDFVPKGYIFGYLKNHSIFSEKEIKDIIHQFTIPPVNLRVFKIIKTQYKWLQPTDEEARKKIRDASPLYWTSQIPQWVKLR